MIRLAPITITVRKNLAANTVDEPVALAKKASAEGKPLTYASVGYGSFDHVLGAQETKRFQDMAKSIKLKAQ